MEYFLQISLIFLISIVFLYYYFHEKNGNPTNWPIFGMFPSLFVNVNRIHDFLVEIMEKNQLNFHFKGPWLANMNFLVTADPTNVNHIMSKNFGNYPKGSEYKEIFDALGNGIFNSDDTMWEYHRKMALSFLNHPNFHEYLVKKTEEKIENGLIPMFDHVSNQGIEIDLQDLFSRFAFDTICVIMMDFDPKSLSIECPSDPPSKALDDLEEVFLNRHVLPPFVWKLQRWLNIGEEKKYKQAWKFLDNFIYNRISIKRSQDLRTNSEINEVGADLLTLYIEEIDKSNNEITPDKKLEDDKFLRDTILNFFVAGKDSTTATLSWFFYLLSKNPQVEKTIREELDKVMNQAQDFSKNSKELCSKLVYLHATLSETLRLYPPVVFESKTPVERETLPSGHKAEPNTRIVFALYAMARMKSIWGDDCCEFKPERWISEQGKIKVEPSYKYLVFNSGPRTCVGREMAFTQLKVIVASILRTYYFEVVEGCHVDPSLSIILHMKNGLKVKVIKR